MPTKGARAARAAARHGERLVAAVLEAEKQAIAKVKPEDLRSVDPSHGQRSAALEAAAFWVAIDRAEPTTREVQLEWRRRRAATEKPAFLHALRRIEGRAAPTAANLVGSGARVALHKSWPELSKPEREAAEALGWWAETWSTAEAPAIVGNRTDGAVASWKDLKPLQLAAARSLGLDARVWELLAGASADEECEAVRDSVAQAAQRLKAQLEERRANNRALHQEAAAVVLDPPWRGHSRRTGWTVHRPNSSRRRRAPQGNAAAKVAAAPGDGKGSRRARRAAAIESETARSGWREEHADPEWREEHAQRSRAWLSQRGQRTERRRPQSCAAASRQRPAWTSSAAAELLSA